MTKTVLMVVGVLLVVMGIWAAVPAWEISGVVMPLWHAIITIVVGVVCVALASQSKKVE
jgi:uncharacterized membrane protein HdeD (DUF308 family)